MSGFCQASFPLVAAQPDVSAQYYMHLKESNSVSHRCSLGMFGDTLERHYALASKNI